MYGLEQVAVLESALFFRIGRAGIWIYDVLMEVPTHWYFNNVSCHMRGVVVGQLYPVGNTKAGYNWPNWPQVCYV